VPRHTAPTSALARTHVPAAVAFALNQVVTRTLELQRFNSASKYSRGTRSRSRAPVRHGDPGQLQQVLMNLMAIRGMPSNARQGRHLSA